MRGNAYAVAASIAIALGLSTQTDAIAADKEQTKACLAAAKKRADQGDGLAAKALAIHYGDSSNPDGSSSQAWRYLSKAIEKGVDVSDVPTARRNITAYCSGDPDLARLVEARPAAKPQAAPAAATRSKPSVAAVPSVPPAGMSGHEPAVVPGAGRDAGTAETAKPVLAALKPTGTTIELERQAADYEWNGNVRGAIPYWEKARQLGSRAAAKRLYQIFSLGAGEVEADYVKAIEAYQYAEQMGLDVPPLPRK